jgi:hypothetical protein
MSLPPLVGQRRTPLHVSSECCLWDGRAHYGYKAIGESEGIHSGNGKNTRRQSNDESLHWNDALIFRTTRLRQRSPIVATN